MKKIASLMLALTLPLVALALIAASPGGGLVAKVDWLLAQFGEGSAFQNDAGRVPPLGTIISSALPYDLMPEGFEKTWYPADGRSVEGTALGNKLLAAKKDAADAKNAYPNLFTPDGKPRAPDLRGVFLRGLNVFAADETTVVDGENKGDPETDDYRFKRRYKRTVGDWQADKIIAHEHQSQSSDGTNSPKYPDDTPEEFGRKNMWVPTTGGGFGPETRPRNIAIYYYVRVN